MLSKNTPELDSNGDEVHLFVISTLAPRLPVILGPNITGRLSYIGHVDTGDINNTQPEHGAFRALNFQETVFATQTTKAIRWIDPSFNAALSNSIYKEFSTVQPESLVLNYVIKY